MISLLLIILLILSILRTFFKYLINSIFNYNNLSSEEREKMTTKAKIIEGRSRILNCLALCGAEEEPVILLELQKAYLANYDTYLNKDEVRAFFGKGHIKQVFQQFMKDDVTMSTNPNETGSLYLQMKRPLAEALIASVPMIAKNSVPVIAEPKKTAVLVPVGALPKMSAVRKEIGKRSSSSFISAYNGTKGFGKMAATGANAIPITMKKVVGNNNYLDEEKDGQREYAASDMAFVSKIEKSVVVKLSSNDKVKSNQPADADGLYSDDDDEVEEIEIQQNDDEEEEELVEQEEKDEEDENEEVDDWENDDDYGWDEKKEDEKVDEMAANGGWLKSAKMNGGQTAVAVKKKTVTSKMPASSTSTIMQNEQLKNGIKQQYKTTVVVNKLALPKPTPAVVEKKPVASANKFAVPSENIFITSEDESALEASTDKMDEAQANEANDIIEIVPEAPKAVVKSGNVMSALAANSDGNTTPRIPTPASLATTETMTAPAPMPDSFKYQMLAIITTLVHIHRIYKVTDLHEMLSKVDGYKTDYATYLPTSDALVQFVQHHCDAINLHKFDVAKDQAFFVLDAKCQPCRTVELPALQNWQIIGGRRYQQLIEPAQKKQNKLMRNGNLRFDEKLSNLN